MRNKLSHGDRPQFFSALWGASEITPWGDIRHDRIECEKARILERFLPPEGTVLDLGCGGGDFLAHVLAPNGAFAKVVGVDVSRRALGRAERTGRYGRLVESDIDDVAQHVAESFSVVLLGEVLYYLRDYLGTLAVAVDRMAEGGLLFLSVGLGPKYFGANDVALIKAFLRGRGLRLLADERLDYKTILGLPRRYLPLYHQTHKVVLVYRAQGR